MMHKFHHIAEMAFVFIAIKFQPLIGVISGLAATIYYLSVLKMNVVDKKHNGSWIQYIKSIFK